MGLPRTNSPVMEADTTNSSNANNGVRKLVVLPKIAWLLKPSQATAATYKNVPTALIKLFETYSDFFIDFVFLVDSARIGLASPQCECGVLPLYYEPLFLFRR